PPTASSTTATLSAIRRATRRDCSRNAPLVRAAATPTSPAGTGVPEPPPATLRSGPEESGQPAPLDALDLALARVRDSLRSRVFVRPCPTRPARANGIARRRALPDPPHPRPWRARHSPDRDADWLDPASSEPRSPTPRATRPVRHRAARR